MELGIPAGIWRCWSGNGRVSWGVGMVYFHFPFSTHAPVPVRQRSWWFKLNLQELGSPEAGSRGPTSVKVCGKIISKKNLTSIPSYLISYITNKGEKKMNTIIPELTVIAIVFATLTLTGVIIW